MRRFTLLATALLALACAPPDEESGTTPFVAGDLVLPEAAAIGEASQGSASSSRWPGGVIPYVNACSESGTINPYADCPATVPKAVAAWNAAQPWVQLVPRTTETDYVAFVPGDSSEAGSYVGRMGGRQDISVIDTASSLQSVSATLHEIGHAAGLWHEMSRTDRDWFLTILDSNLASADRPQFERHDDAIDIGLYDFGSIMHYNEGNAKAFAVDKTRAVMVRRDNRADGIGNISGTLSFGDAYALRKLYMVGDATAGDVNVALAANTPGVTYDYTQPRDAYAPVRKVSDFLCGNPLNECRVADVNGDGKGDLIAFDHAGTSNGVVVQLSDGGGFAPYAYWHNYFCVAGEVCATGDVTGDGAADIIAFQHGATPAHPGRSQVWVANSTKTGFAPSFMAFADFCSSPWEQCLVGDVDGDKSADLVSVDLGTGDVRVATSNPAPAGLVIGGPKPPFNAPVYWGRAKITPAASSSKTGAMKPGVGLGSHVPAASIARADAPPASYHVAKLGDVDHDGKADIVWFDRMSSGRVYVALSTGAGLAPAYKAHDYFCVYDEACDVADADGDGRADVLAFTHDASGLVWLARANHWAASSPTFMSSLVTQSGFCKSGAACAVGDVNGDSAADLVSFTR